MICLDHVTYRYQNAEEATLRDITLEIPKGQCVLLCGASGSGKTTLSRLLNGLIPQYFEGELIGSVRVGALTVSEAELYDTARVVGSVFQNPRSQFFCVDTTSELAFGCENMGLPEEEILERVDRVRRDLGLDGLMDRNIFELSGGEKQKIACASVSALDPDVYVLDEPTSNLDTAAIEDLKKTVALWKSQGKTVIIAEHRLYWLRELCERVIYMKDGAVGFDRSMAEFCTLKEEALHALGLRGLTLSLELPAAAVPEAERRAELKNFTFSYDKKEALRIGDLTLPLGGIIAVIGRNGAGKSTLSRCICGLEKKFKGTLVLDGRTLKRKDLLRSGYLVMQDVNHQLFCETVEEEVRLGMAQGQEDRAGEILKKLDLDALTDRHPMSLSGGQKQRVAIAAALLAGKQFLVFDEPTSGLDYHHMMQTGACIGKNCAGKTVLIVTHDPELICTCCTHVLELEEGRAKACYPLDRQGMDAVRAFFLGFERSVER